VLIVFSGLPGSGKTTIAQELALELGAVYLRMDSIEQAIRDCGISEETMYDAGYRIGCAIAEDNLKAGRTVVADCVNPLSVSRDAWTETAKRARSRVIEIEIVCSDPNEHRKRVETRVTDVPGARLPTWQDVLSHRYEPWNRQRIVIDTASQTPQQNVHALREAIARQKE
jgi:predicted kinase